MSDVFGLNVGHSLLSLLHLAIQATVRQCITTFVSSSMHIKHDNILKFADVLGVPRKRTPLCHRIRTVSFAASVAAPIVQGD